MGRYGSSQELWTEGEALERAGKPREAVALFVKAALAEEDQGEPMRARLLWEQVADRTGPTGSLLERLASNCARAKLREDAVAYWLAAAAQYAAEDRPTDAERARGHLADFRKAPPPAADRPLLAEQVIARHRDRIADLLG
jgi:hypothetical protein